MSRKRTLDEARGDSSVSAVHNPEEPEGEIHVESRKRQRAAVSPLVNILNDAVKEGTVVKSETSPPVYTGFAQYASLMKSGCTFLPMNTNRAINDDVVTQRVHENEESFSKFGTYL